MSCKMCRDRGKTWNGDDPKCAFPDFEGNWNCATVNAIRDICYEGQNLMPAGVAYQYCENMKYATIKIDHLEDKRGGRLGYALWVCWYKSRGGTDALWILDSEEPPRRPTEEDLLTIIAAYPPTP